MILLALLSSSSAVSTPHRRFVLEQLDLKSRSGNTEIQLACMVLMEKLT